MDIPVEEKTEGAIKERKIEEKFSASQIESIFSAILHYSDFPVLNKNHIGKSYTKQEWIDIFFTDLEKDNIKWPQ